MSLHHFFLMVERNEMMGLFHEMGSEEMREGSLGFEATIYCNVAL